MSLYYKLDDENRVVSADDSADLFAWLDARRSAAGQEHPTATLQIAYDLWGDHPDCVSTVFLGVDYGFGEGPPLVFETMLFTDDERDSSIWRYSSWNEALLGHEAVIEAVRNRTDLPA